MFFLFANIASILMYSKFLSGKFYEMFHMDADIGVQKCGLSYMKGHVAHAGFPEIAYGAMADKLVRAGYKVTRVEQTETPEQLGIRKKTCGRGVQAPKVVNREVCSILTMGTRTFCYLDDESSLLCDETAITSGLGPLLAIREIILTDELALEESSVHKGDDIDGDHDDNVEPVCEYGITLVDAMRGSVTIGQFADDVLRSRLVTLLTSFSPAEVRLVLLVTYCNIGRFKSDYYSTHIFLVVKDSH
jgi:DNA mismatch repair protein MSH6